MEHASAAEELRNELDVAARRLGRHPQLGSARPYLPATYRLWLLSRFGYVLVYDRTTDPVEILRFVHTRRDLPRVLGGLPSSQGD